MIVEKVRSLWSRIRVAEGSDTIPETDSSSGSPSSKLFSCPDCEVVYLALEKETCSSCSAEVTEVSPSLTGG